MKSPFKRYVILNIIAGSVIFGLFAGLLGLSRQQEIVEPAPPISNITKDSIDLPSADDPLELKGEILPFKGMFQALMAMGLSNELSLKVVNVLRFKVELTKIQVGEKISALLSRDSSQVLEVMYNPDPVTYHKLVSEADTLRYELVKLETETRYRIIEGQLQEGSSLNDMLLQSEVPHDLTQVVNGVLLCKISFRTDARKGDTFKVMLREQYYEHQRISGAVMYASYRGRRTGFFEAYKYTEDDPKSSYNAHYLKDGEALIHSGLRYPIDRLHISSTYGMRRHPVTGRRAMHNGVDYAARTGTRVYAVAKGKVVASSYDRYSGNKVAIKHNDNSTSYYLHLSQRSVTRGQTVRARQVIGRVGATGRVTGPHLHFGFKNSRGRWMNPLRKRMIATPKLTGDRLARLLSQIDVVETNMREQEAMMEQVAMMHTLGFDVQGVPLLQSEETVD